MIRRLLLAVVLALLVVAMVAAQRQHAVAPASGQSLLYLVADSERDLTAMPAHFTRITDADEIKYGNVLAREIDSPTNLTPDEQRVAAYMAEVGKKVARSAHRRLPYQFHYLRDHDFTNAYALPGGHIVVGSGLIERMKTEDELAAVIGHEIEHVDHYHCAERLQVEAALRKIPLGAIAAIPIAVFQAGYSKDQELEADREGVLLAARSGYSANGAVRAFEMLAKLYQWRQEHPRTPQQEAAQVATDVLAGYFRSHPLPDDRLAQVRAMIARDPALAARAETPLSIDYILLAWDSLSAVHDGNFAVARDLASRALARQPGHPTALQGLALADYGLGQYGDAERTYRALLDVDPAKADAVEKWCVDRAQALFDANDYDRLIALASSVLAVQPGQPPLLRLKAFGEAMQGNSTAAIATGETLHKLYPDQANQAAPEATNLAVKMLDSGKFPQAIAMSNLAFTLNATQVGALATRGAAEIARADFAAAMKSYGDQFDPATADTDWLRAYAVAAAVANPKGALASLDAKLANQDARQIPDGALRVERAGLGIMAGNDAEAKDVVARVKSGALAPELLPRLAWWYLQANRLADADAVLKTAQALRPGDAEVQNAMAWLALEQGKPANAIVASQGQSADAVRQNGRDVRESLAAWQQGRANDAVQSWSAIIATKPQWQNPAWRNALYPPRIAATAAALESERSRRAAAKIARR